MSEVVIFDTNAYLNCVRIGKTHEYHRENGRAMRAAAIARGDIVMISPIVLLEIVNYLDSDDHKKRSRSERALCLISTHCASSDDDRSPLQMVLGTEPLLSSVLFDTLAEPYHGNNDELQKLAVLLGAELPRQLSNNEKKIVATHRRNLEAAETRVLSGLDVFARASARAIDNVSTREAFRRSEIAKEFKTSFMDPHAFEEYAREIVGTIARLVNRTPTQHEHDQLAAEFTERFATPIQLLVMVLEKLVDNPSVNVMTSKKSWRNTAWDMGLAYYLGPNHKIEDRDVVIVTDDKEIRTAAEKLGVSDRIRSVSDYRVSIDEE